MNPFRICAFIAAVFIALAALCAFFPEDGISVGGVNLEFPTLSEVLSGGEEVSTVDPQEEMRREMESIENARRNEYMEYFRSNPARLQFPGDDYSLLDGFFAALDNASSRAVRVVHYGDSQIEADRVTHSFRAGFQKRFGGGGPGLMPVFNGYYTYSAAVSVSAELERHMVFGPAEMRGNSGQYGPMAWSSALDTTVFASIYSIKNNKTSSRYFNRLTVFAANTAGSVSVRYGKDSRQMKTSGPDDMAVETFVLRDSSVKAGLSLSGNADLFGVSLHTDTGVTVDNVPMRGCSGTVFTKIKASHLRKYYDYTNTRLIILEYGGNSVPYMKTEKQVSEYKGYIEKQIAYLRKLAPSASVVFIGPSDMATTVNGRRQTYPNLPMVVDSLRAAALSSGAVYWDLYSAMGGEGSMIRWVKSQPPLAGSDYVHFTSAGADLMGEMFYKTLMVYYDYYKWRREERR